MSNLNELLQFIATYSNLCDRELGKKLREEMEQTRQLEQEGYKAKVVAMEAGKKLREEKKVLGSYNTSEYK